MTNITMAPIEGEVFAPGRVQVTVLDHPMAKRRIELVDPGQSVSAIVQQFAGNRACSVTADGRRIGLDERDQVMAISNVQIVCVPGKNVGRFFRAIAGLAIAIIAAAVAGPLVGALFPALTGTAATIATAAVTGGLTLLGNLALNALFPIAQPQLAADQSTSPTYSIGGGRNRANPFGPIPVILGTHRASPPYAALPYTELSGDDQYLTILVCWGYGPMHIGTLKIGETDIDEFEDVEVQTFAGFPDDPKPSLYPNQVIEEALNVELEPETDNVRTTTERTDRITIDLQAPAGLYRYRKDDAKRVDHAVTVNADIRRHTDDDSEPWTRWFSETLTGSDGEAIRRAFSHTVERGRYDVRIVRQTPKDDSEDQVSERLYWSAIRSVTNESPVNAPEPLALTAIRIRATAQLSGNIETLNAQVTCLVKSWNAATARWDKEQQSSNPADLLRHVLQGPANKKPVPDTAIDLETLAEWHDYCAAKGFTFDQYRDFRVSVWSTLKDICAAGRANPTFIDGKWSVIWDDADAPVVQHFTPLNSRDFSASRGYPDKVQAFRVRFIDADNAWQQDERLVFADGYNRNNTERYEVIEFPGVTNRDLVWKHARYHIAQLKLRREVYQITTDFEHLACVRGDRVLLTHDVPKIGAGFGRIKTVAGNRVTLDTAVTLQAGQTQVLRIRLADGTSSLRRIATAGPAETDTLDLAPDGRASGKPDVRASGKPDVTEPEAGDLFAFGVMGAESSVCRVRAIRPSGNFAATLELVDDAPQIHHGDKAPVPDFTPTTPAPVDPFNYPPVALGAVPFEELVEGGLIAGVRLSWSPPPQPGVVAYLYQVRTGDGEWSKVYRVSGHKATVRDVPAGPFEFRVKAEFANGAISTWSRTYVVDVPDPDRTPATDIVHLEDIQDDTLDLFAELRQDLDGIFERMDILGAAAAVTLGEQTLKALELDITTGVLDTEVRKLDITTGALDAEVRKQETERIEADEAIAETVETVRASTVENGAAVQREAQARADGDAANARLAEAARAKADEVDAAVARESDARVRADTAIARLTEAAQVRANEADAAVRREAQVRARADTANARLAEAAQAKADEADAAVVREAEARADGDAANGRLIEAAQAKADEADAAVRREAQVRARADTANARLAEAAQAKADEAAAAVVREAEARADGDAANGRLIEAAQAKADQADAAVRREAQVRARADEAITRTANTARASAGRANAAVQAEANTRARADTANARLAEAAQAKADEADAAVRREANTRARADEAIAETVEAARATAADALAGGAFRLQAEASSASTLARFSVLVKAGIGDRYIDSGMVIEVTGTRRRQRSRIAFKTDQFSITDGRRETLPFVFENGVAKIAVASVGHIDADVRNAHVLYSGNHITLPEDADVTVRLDPGPRRLQDYDHLLFTIKAGHLGFTTGSIPGAYLPARKTLDEWSRFVCAPHENLRGEDNAPAFNVWRINNWTMGIRESGQWRHSTPVRLVAITGFINP